MILFKLACLACSLLAACAQASPALPSLVKRSQDSSPTFSSLASQPTLGSSTDLSLNATGNFTTGSEKPEIKYTSNSFSCPGLAGQVAQQAMADAATMAALLLKGNNWQQPQYQAALTKYMGGNCLTGTYQDGQNNKAYKDWINTVLTNIANAQWRWYDSLRGLIPFVGLASTTINLYCNGAYPSFQDDFTPTCQANTYGWSHSGYSHFLSQFLTYAVGFCTEHFYNSYVPLSSMVRHAQLGTVDKNDEEALGGNYGRVAVHQFVELSPAINLWTSSQAAADVASRYGCSGSPSDREHLQVISSLNNADNWAHWINAVYFQITLNMKDTVPNPGKYDDSPGDLIEKYDCKGAGLCKYMDQSECTKAIAKIDDNTIYTKYMTRTQKSQGHSKGCMARFQCLDNLCPPEGVNGSTIKARLDKLYTPGLCGTDGRCGSIYGDDYTQVTLNMCTNCHDDG